MKSPSTRFPSSLAALLLACVPAAHAQSGSKETLLQPDPRPAAADEWKFTFTSYLWLPSVDLDISMPDVTIGNRTFGGDFSIDQPWWDTLSDFSSDFYVLSLSGRLEAWKGRWGGFIDGYWIF